MPTDQTAPVNHCFIDTETTHLDSRLGDVIEASWALNRGAIKTARFPHTLDSADPAALRINRYYERRLHRYGSVGGFPPAEYPTPNLAHDLIQDLMTRPTLVAENYGFDNGYLVKKLGIEPWHYRKIELSTYAMAVFNLRHPEGLSETRLRLLDEGYTIPENDHSSRADVACLRDCFYALLDLRKHHMRVGARPAADFPLVG